MLIGDEYFLPRVEVELGITRRFNCAHLPAKRQVHELMPSHVTIVGNAGVARVSSHNIKSVTAPCSRDEMAKNEFTKE